MTDEFMTLDSVIFPTVFGDERRGKLTVLLLRIYTPEYKIYKVGSSLEIYIYIYINMLQDMPLNINYIKRDLF